MKSKYDISKLFIAVILLIAFSNAYVNGFICLCNLDHCKITSSKQIHYRSDENHDNAPEDEEHHHDKGPKAGDCNSDDGSCDCENTAPSVLSDLLRVVPQPEQLKIRNFVIQPFIENISKSKYDYLTTQPAPCHSKIPPPKITDIRIFIQSFII